ncbi:metal ABC transporter substrate-binding protein [Thermobispora bispora]|uniref:Periplasmic solute binding protein n=1 Tax=Thermobispora bispora (strain ATCC 19993 / DSM 43833 / CBS 139.67 / JCM 10125 / KCTC 9307 / NBRC 14880 / R51) TaxID=469371 RepID=D6Y446_THEBD|nr:metal ABC transporter substrate-binding protein [Thermobispora bispora]ADG87100.1 periplasmic solute binding protein [Thermobispora bispora DSM 43833]MDI9580470.1 metal ABC transporter substrate-binding protein [Thermobispora sp.]
MLSLISRSLCIALLVLTAVACGGASGPPSADGSRLNVVATTTQVADFAANIGGDKVRVHGLLKPNVDPHDYEPTPLDMRMLAEADVVVKNGVGFEKWLDQAIEASGFRGTLVDASQGVRLRTGEGASADPHIWHDPRNAKTMAANIARAFAAADAANAAVYEQNLAAYQARLDELDAEIEKKIQSIPEDRRKLVTDHDTFGYYADRYGLTVVGSVIPSFDTSAELSAKQITDLVARIKAAGVTAIFSEASLPPKTAEAIGREAGVRVVAGEDALYGDSLGPEGSAGATYLQMMRHNTDTIVAALGGAAT